MGGDTRHGSCGVGYGETVRDQIERSEVLVVAGELDVPSRLKGKREALRDARHADLEADRHALVPLPRRRSRSTRRSARVRPRIRRPALGPCLGPVRRRAASPPSAHRPRVFESAQGVLLDEQAGFHPCIAWSTTTFDGAEHVLDDLRFRGPRMRLGVRRLCSTRHGQGPMPSEDSALTLDKPHNVRHDWRGAYRQCPLEVVQLRYGLTACGHVRGLGRYSEQLHRDL
jgi:adenylosuccinate synthase